MSKLQNIEIKTVLHKDQRYETVGDWFDGPANKLIITVSSMGQRKYELLVAVHELIEALLCQERGISQSKVDGFDKAYEKQRAQGDTSEPGDSPEAPYRKEHFFATSVERLLAAELGVDWKAYEDAVNAL